MAELEYLTPEEVAEKLRIHERTVRRLLADGKLPGERIGGKKWRISAAALSAYLGAQPTVIARGSVKQVGEGRVMRRAPGVDPFAGDLDAARRRLHDLTAKACEVLDASLLNTLSFHLAMYVDHDAGGCFLTDRMEAELEAERQRYASAKAKKARKAQGK